MKFLPTSTAFTVFVHFSDVKNKDQSPVVVEPTAEAVPFVPSAPPKSESNAKRVVEGSPKRSFLKREKVKDIDFLRH